MAMNKEQTRMITIQVCGLIALFFGKVPQIMNAANLIQFLAMNHWDEVWSIVQKDSATPRFKVSLSPVDEVK